MTSTGQVTLTIVMALIFSYTVAFSPNVVDVSAWRHPLSLKRNVMFENVRRHRQGKTGVQSLQCRIIEISRRKASIIAPPSVTRQQWSAYWGMNSTERVQRIVECVMFAYGGAWLAWFTSFMAGQLVASIIGTATVFNWMYNPWIYAKKRTAKLWPSSRKLHYGVFSARIKSLSRIKRKVAKSIGGASPEFLEMIVEDECGRRLDVLTQWQDSYSNLRMDMLCESLICASESDFKDVAMVTEVWVPSVNIWVGDYPYLDKLKFKNFVNEALSKSQSRSQMEGSGMQGSNDGDYYVRDETEEEDEDIPFPEREWSLNSEKTFKSRK
eukprot:gene10911-22774_t